MKKVKKRKLRTYKIVTRSTEYRQGFLQAHSEKEAESLYEDEGLDTSWLASEDEEIELIEEMK